MHRPLVFLDIETTGGSALSSRVLEIGAIRVENNEIVGRYSQLINPDEYIPSFITGITGIDDSMVADAPQFHEVQPELNKFLDGALFIAHNVSFDYSFIKEEHRRLGVGWNMDRMCTVRLSRALFPHEKRHNLNYVIERMGYKVMNRHRAYDDAEVLARFYFDALKLHGLQLYPIMDRLTTKTR
jgi:DNA polymerase III subunit epsilon